MKKIKTTIICDKCDKEFTTDYDADTETPDDAAWMHSCVSCGLVLCYSCASIHNRNECIQEEETYED